MEGSDHDDHHQTTAGADNQEEEVVEMASSEEPVRSYDCTFCKRGFSNAQALGGHMNIHRKDKAKLKQQAAASSNNTIIVTDHHQNQNQQSSFEVSKIGQSYSPPIPTNRFPPSVVLQPSMEAIKAKRGWNILCDQDKNHVDATKTNKTSHVAIEEVKQLPLFVETPSMISTGDQDDDDHHHHHRKPSGSQVYEKVSSSSSSGSFSEVDLELRLGPEPQDSSSSATGTKKFF